MTRLKQILKEEGRSQTWLAGAVAKHLGRPVDRSLVNKYVNGLIAPEDVQRAIAAVLGRDVDDVFGPVVETEAA